jgi:monovalent cation:H+ antiporter-2, CPA2 family
MQTGMLEETLLLLLAAIVAVAAFLRLRLPPVLGYMLIGIAAGSHGLGLLPKIEHVSGLAWFGVVFLLFTIGLEFSLSKVTAMSGTLLLLGAGQVFATTAAVASLAWAAGIPRVGALVVGAVLAQSSSTIIGRLLTEQQEIGSRHGRLSMGISVLQDVTALPFVVLLPALASGAGSGAAAALLTSLGKAALAFALLLAAGRWLLRPLLQQIAALRSAELLTLTALLAALTAAWLTELAGLSLALGAFLGGMIVGETQFRHQLEAEIRPFRDVLLGMFMVVIGMTLDVRALTGIWHWALLLAAGALVVKALLVAGLVSLSREHRTVSLRCGLVLAVGGEFGVALLALALQGDLLPPAAAQTVLAAVVMSMLFGPLLIRYNGAIAGVVFPAEHAELAGRIESAAQPLEGHVILCGYGRVGQAMARVLEQDGIICLGIDFDPARVRETVAAGERVYYGDCGRPEILVAAGMARARLLVITFDDLSAGLAILRHARELRSDMPVLVRTRDDHQMEVFERAGATEAVPETLEASLTLTAHALRLLGEPDATVARRIEEIRRSRYLLLRGFFPGEGGLEELDEALGERRLRAVHLPAKAAAVGRSVSELMLQEHGVLLAAVRRGARGAPVADSKARLQTGDVLLLYGQPDALDRAERLLLNG